MINVFYVSVSTLNASTAHREIEQLVEQAVLHNSLHAITGALIFAGNNFAQALEGDDELVTALMDKILLDTRHRCVTVLRQGPITARRFGAWSLAYSGGATYIGRSLGQLLQPSATPQTREIDRVYALMDHLVGNVS